MKRIEFIAPVEAMRGNLSGSQTLEYPLNANPAYLAPDGKHYATNYQPRFIGAKRASDGLKYFAVKTKSAINKTANSTLAMAVLGGCGAIVGAILANKSSDVYVAIENLFVETKPKRNGKEISLRAWLSESIMYGLRNKMDAFSWTGLEQGVPTNITVLNPFVQSDYTADYTVTISNDILVKFWNALANNPFVAEIEGQTFIAHAGDTFGSVASSSYNVLGLRIIEVSNVQAVCSKDSTTEAGSMLEYVVSSIPNTLTDRDPVTVAERYKLTWTEYPA